MHLGVVLRGEEVRETRATTSVSYFSPKEEANAQFVLPPRGPPFILDVQPGSRGLAEPILNITPF